MTKTLNLTGLTAAAMPYAACIVALDRPERPTTEWRATLQVLGLCRTEHRHEQAATYIVCIGRGMTEKDAGPLLQPCRDAGEQDAFECAFEWWARESSTVH